ncbi:MAG: glycoside hydrolase family 92 protein, partial [Bacteroidetes bacterium]|nr:glycoside hydrolase family 92 protein [Bacteroidota bacterium]
MEIEDTCTENMKIFYSALYHSLLIPWVISDFEGYYKGIDGIIHKAKGENQYGVFSPWDSFRSLHPLLCLLTPDRQNDMILSMLDIYEQSGQLPKGPMTGNHIIPIIVDSYLKGITNFDKTLAYEAMNKALISKPFYRKLYDQHGYIPFSYPESVTRTVEYAYNDWALAQFSKQVMQQNKDYELLLHQSYNYRNLFNSQERFLLPRKTDEYILKPGNFGYKEGNKWIYSLFVPHNIKDIIN